MAEAPVAADPLEPRARRCLAIARGFVVAALTVAVAGAANAGDDDGASGASPSPHFPRGLVEVKRQATGRGTPEETTKTNLKLDLFPADGALSLLRLELPFPDHKTTFTGSPFDPALGDIKTRIGFRAFDVAGPLVTSFVEVTFPTARPAELGTGKLQLSAGVNAAFRLPPGPAALGAPRGVFSIQAQQLGSIAGDATREDIHQTKFEVTWRETWPEGDYAKATAKPVVDWIGARTGAVLELEGGAALDPRWTVALLGGGRLWGKGVPGTYDTRIELKLVHRY